jgi:hypothetical protein
VRGTFRCKYVLYIEGEGEAKRKSGLREDPRRILFETRSALPGKRSVRVRLKGVYVGIGEKERGGKMLACRDSVKLLVCSFGLLMRHRRD